MKQPCCLLCLLILFLGGSTAVTAVGVYDKTRPIDLNGRWTADPGILLIEHNLTTNQFTAIFADQESAKCEHGGESRSFYLKGTLSESSFEGEMQRCTDDPIAKEDCNMPGWVWTTKVKGSVTADTITTEYRSNWYDYDSKKEGRYVNCRRDESGDRWKSEGTARAECPKSNPDTYEIKINIKSELPTEYPVNQTLEKAKLTKLMKSKRSIDAGSAVASGLTLTGKPKLRPEPSLDTWIGPASFGDRKCFGVEAINVTIDLPDLEVYVAKDYKVDSCQYKIVHGHEMLHVTDAWKSVYTSAGELRELLTDLAKKFPTPRNALVVASDKEAERKSQQLLKDVMWPTERIISEIWSEIKRRSYDTDWIGDYIELGRQIDSCPE